MKSKLQNEIEKMKLANLAASGFIAAFIFFCLASVAWAALIVGKHLIHYKCSDFSSAQAAKDAYDHGATYLDKGNHDGIPCNALQD